MNYLKFYVFALALCAFVACSKEGDIEPGLGVNDYACDLELAPALYWPIEEFKAGYQIQFPTNYTGLGLGDFETNTFEKNREDNGVEFSFLFCGIVGCESYGTALSNNPIPKEVEITDLIANIMLSLDQRITFCMDGTAEMFFYHNLGENRTGKLYMKQGEEYLEALNVSYAKSAQAEVESIIRTISPS